MVVLLIMFNVVVLTAIVLIALNIQWTLESRTQSVPRGGSTFNFFDFRVKFPHKK
jgi:hypothetical protein